MNEAQEGITERVDAYTAQRLGGGDAQIAGVLARCEGLTHGEALDVGYGAGFETFALASRFERVVAIDNRADFIRKARRIARDRGVENITFLRHEALEPLPDTHRFDFVYCNNMSHHVASRCRLIARLADAVRPGGWLFMSEEAEGLPPMMIEQALDTRDDVALRVFSRNSSTVSNDARLPPLRTYQGWGEARRAWPLPVHGDRQRGAFGAASERASFPAAPSAAKRWRSAHRPLRERSGMFPDQSGVAGGPRG
jgi:SAM-dependent methyltransferase